MCLTLTSGGCNSLHLCLAGARAVYSVDCNPAQSALLELKQVAIRQLGYSDVWALFGKKRERLGTIPGLARHFQIALGSQRTNQPQPNHEMIIHYENTNGCVFHNTFKVFGTVTERQQPFCGAVSKFNSPPILAARSRMPMRPKCGPGIFSVA